MMSEQQSSANRLWGFAWLGLGTALALHVIDEALTGFLPLYNSIVTEIRDSYPWFPMPIFTFPVWIGGLITGILILFLLSPLVFAGRLSLRYISYPLSVLMILNGLGHIGASVYWGILAPGVYSSPFLLLAAAALLVATFKVGNKVDVGV
jgi:hypothetical protein